MTRTPSRGPWVVMALVTVCLSPPVAARETTEADRKALLDHRQRTQSAFLTSKVQAPEPLQPKGAFKDKASVIAAFKEARAETIRLAGDGGRDLRACAMDSPLGALDAYQWLLFVTAHTERHTKQVEEVKSTNGFPPE